MDALTTASIDCDTRVPVDCLLYGALEMHESRDFATWLRSDASGPQPVREWQ